MNPNDDIRYLSIGLPEDIAMLKAAGELDEAIRLIDLRLNDPRTTAPLAACMRVEKEIIKRLPETILIPLKRRLRAYAGISPTLPRRSSTSLRI